jgi:hypothetical protein
MNTTSIAGPGGLGLPLALRLARGGSRAPGIDRDPAKTGDRNAGPAANRCPNRHKA